MTGKSVVVKIRKKSSSYANILEWGLVKTALDVALGKRTSGSFVPKDYPALFKKDDYRLSCRRLTK